MTEEMISTDDAKELGFAIHEMVDDLETRGFSRAQIGSAMVGIGAALAHIHAGHDNALGVLNMVRDCLLADASDHQ